MPAMALFRGMGKLRESSRRQKTSWKTFEKVAMVRGLTAMESERGEPSCRERKIKRPSQILGSMLLSVLTLLSTTGPFRRQSRGSSTGSG